jgi:trimethylamine corrinoid protein
MVQRCGRVGIMVLGGNGISSVEENRMRSETLELLKSAITDGQADIAKEYASRVLAEGLDPIIIVEELTKTVREIGERFAKLELFLSDLMGAGLAMKEAIEILKSSMVGKDVNGFKKVRIVLGTVTGDIHDIGKAVVGAMLTAGGFDVTDLGIDVPTTTFIEKAKEIDANMIAASALMSTSMPYQKDLLRLLTELNLRRKFRVLIGGGATSQTWATEIGADGYAPDAVQAVKVVGNLIGAK